MGKKLIFGSLFFMGLSFFSLSFAETQPSSNNDYGEGFGDNTIVGGIAVPLTDDESTTDEDGSDSLITSIKTAINRVLGLLGLIALCVLLWGGFQMVTAAGDDGKYKKGFKILQQAAMGLMFIGVSRLFVSLVFWLIDQFTKAA